MQLHD